MAAEILRPPRVGIATLAACARFAAWAAPLLFVTACAKDPPEAARTRESAAPRRAPPLLLEGGLASETAFDLVPAPFGASVLWAPRETSAGLRALDLNQRGVAERPPIEILGALPGAGKRMDLSYAFLGLERAAAWSERVDAEARVQALLKPETAEARVFDLGAGFAAAASARGNLSLGVEGDSAVVFARGAPESCGEEDVEGCFAFRFHRLRDGSMTSTGVSLSVPVPCESHAAELLLSAPRWHYAVCTENEGKPVSTVFTIQPSPEYASAEPHLPGCLPLGALRFGDESAILATCDNGADAEKSVLRLHGEARPPHVERFASAPPICRDGRPRLRLGTTEVDVAEARGAVELLLPEEVASAGARAAWAGRVLVVAAPTLEGLSLSRFECAGDALVPAP